VRYGGALDQCDGGIWRKMWGGECVVGCGETDDAPAYHDDVPGVGSHGALRGERGVGEIPESRRSESLRTLQNFPHRLLVLIISGPPRTILAFLCEIGPVFRTRSIFRLQLAPRLEVLGRVIVSTSSKDVGM